jgi:non-ribosomal peptide synthetase component F
METSHSRHAIWAKCLHPSGFVSEFSKEEVEQSIASRFEKIVSKYPARIAVKTKNHVLTYAELNAMANRVARAILAQQGGEVTAVGLLLENGASLMAAMLGVLKSGKFFVLVDPSFPKGRIATILEDSQAGLVITNGQHVSLGRKLKDSSGCRLLECESIDGSISAEDLKLRISPKAFASIAYTSGSTGQPKGVVWDHQDLLHRIMLRTNENHACEHDRLALLAAGTANAVTEIFTALLNGAALLPFDVQKEGVTRLASWLLQERISICPISSPLFRNLCETLTGEERFPDLRLVR